MKVFTAGDLDGGDAVKNSGKYQKVSEALLRRGAGRLSIG
jgi:hypothetical protein